MAITFRIENITPEKADAYLSMRLPNRHPKPSAVARFAHDMAAGRWQLAQPLMFDDRGNLIDGQNRLLAVIRSGAKSAFCVLSGFPAAVQVDVDSGTSRKAADNLQIAGQKNTTLLAAATRLVMVSRTIGWRYPFNILSRRSSITSRSEELEEALSNDSLRRCVSAAAAAKVVSRMLRGPASLAWFLCANEALGYGSESKAFVDSLGAGACAQGTPGDVLLRRLNSGSPADRRMSPKERIGLFIQGWNSHITGGTRKFVRVTPGDPFPVLHGAQK